jgi:alkylated DNA repair dioxygenase AlkB
VTALRPGLDLRRPMEAVTELGGALVEDAIEPAFLRELASLTTKLSFQRMAAEEGRARQGGDYWVTTEPFDELPLVKQLGDDLAGRIRSLQVGASSWIPNEVYVQRYRVGDLGVTPHRDWKRYRYLVAIFTAAGEAEFMLCKNRAGEVLRSWTTTPGSLVLLRAPGFGGVDDGRLLHTVRGPSAGERISVTYRMDSRSGQRATPTNYAR